MDNDRPIIFEGNPGLCRYCAFGSGRVSGLECGQWTVTRPVAVSDCRSFRPVEMK